LLDRRGIEELGDNMGDKMGSKMSEKIREKMERKVAKARGDGHFLNRGPKYPLRFWSPYLSA
jgi:hypothetical protein